MAKFGKYKDISSQYNVDKRVIITGKGPSLSLINKEKVGDRYIACVNESSIYFDKVDFNFFNDVDLIKNYKKHNYDLSRIDNLIIPLQPHIKMKPSRYTCHDFMKDYSQHNMKVFTHKLFTQSKKIDNPKELFDDVELGVVNSTYHIALKWLILVGFRNFDIYGISRSGGYDKKYKGPTPNSDSFYNKNYEEGLKILKRNNCDYNIH